VPGDSEGAPLHERGHPPLMFNATTCPIGFLTTLNISTTVEAQAEALANDLAQQLPVSITLASVLLVCSLFILLFGKRLAKPTLFLAAFLSATAGSFYGVDAVLALEPGLPPATSCAVLTFAPLVIGLVAGFLALCLLSLGFALLGAGAGAGVGYAAYQLGLHQIPSPPVGQYDLCFALALSIGALLGAIVMVRAQDALLIVATSLVGAAGATPAIALLLAHANPEFVKARSGSPYRYAQAALLVGLCVIGLAFQCRHEQQRRAKTGPTALRSASVPLIGQ